MRWMAHQPRVGAARLAGPLLSIDAANASERLLLRRLLVLQQLLCLAPTSTVGGVAEGKDARILPLSATAHFICDAYSRGEPRLRAAALRAAASLFESSSRASPADARALHQLLKVRAAAALSHARVDAPSLQLDGRTMLSDAPRTSLSCAG